METEGRDGIRRGGLWREQHFSRRGLRGGWNWVSRETRVGPRRPRAEGAEADRSGGVGASQGGQCLRWSGGRALVLCVLRPEPLGPPQTA